MADNEKLLETIEDTAQRLSVSRSKVCDLLNCQELDGVNIGRARRVIVASSKRFVEKLKNDAT